MNTKIKSKFLITAVFLLTAATVVGYPMFKDRPGQAPIDTSVVTPPAQGQRNIEVVFVLDTTGSMSGLIHAAKEKIWSIASSMASAQNAPDIKMGLVAYRDRGDEYVTKVVDLSSDLDSMYATLMDFQANGGGDSPESVNQALYDAVHKISWSQDKDTYQVVFLVGDAPAHMDYQDDVKYPTTLKLARQRGIFVNAIQCGQDSLTTPIWQQVAQIGGGDYFQVDQAGSAVAVSTPFDRELAEVSRKIEETVIHFGSKEEKARHRSKLAAIDKLRAGASEESLARRAEFNASKSGKANFLGDKELVTDVMEGRVDLSTIKKESLPESMQTMSLPEQESFVAEQAAKRKKLDTQLRELSEKRQTYLKQKAKEAGGYKDSLDEKIYGAVRAQAADKGFSYESDSATY